MSFSKIRGFFSRHKNKFIVGGTLLVGSVLFTKYAQQRLKEWQERETTEFIERNRKLNHFESIARTCNQTIVSLSGALYEVVSKHFDTEDIVENIKKYPEAKVELWNKLKISVFSKIATIIYSTVMLMVTLKIQFSIIGGYLYRDPNSMTTELQEKYLSLCQSFLDNSIVKIARLAEKEMETLLQGVELTKRLKLSDLEAIFWSLQTSLASHDESPIEKFKSYIISDVESTSDTHEKLLLETADLLESDEVKSIATHCVNRSFILFGDKLSEFYNGDSTIDNSIGDGFQNPFNESKPLAKLIPIINGMLTKNSFPYLLVQNLSINDKLSTLSANIYESYL
ncbi:unnamed protein product [Acanthoscelides obtectus]|uniref:Peroxisomal biogenesis factor 3 n=1 Tax=Acanthoscelides obtectus TaxID=200917 RepID=A0A9P0PEY6_ACAOB|nr:unnamed protein product [Acanthoscelides obtectus]CAK1657339.1 Peroxisomal biogenesis factor 3 [Acanthoscelides obtectus]